MLYPGPSIETVNQTIKLSINQSIRQQSNIIIKPEWPEKLANRNIFRMLKAGAHLRKALRKIPSEAVSSAVSSRVRWSFCEFYASRDREENIWISISRIASFTTLLAAILYVKP